MQKQFGKVFGDKGYINKALADLLFGDGFARSNTPGIAVWQDLF